MERVDFAEQIRKNRRSSWLLLLSTFTLLTIVALGINAWLRGGWIIGAIAVVVAFGLTWTSYLKSDEVALAATRAVPADPEQFAQLHNVVEGMALAAGLPKPRVFVVNDPAPNAFATGRNAERAAVAVTTGLLQKMNRDELEGVLAHELSHIKNEDMRVMTIAVATAGAIALIVDIFWRVLWFGGGRRRNDDNGGNPIALIGLIVVLILAPISAVLLQAALSRRRESMADATGVALTRYPTGLRRALEKLYADSTVVQHTSHATAHLWIEQPNETEPGTQGSRLNSLYDTHPPLVDRINALRSMEGLPPFTEVEPDILADLERRSRVAPPAPTVPAGDLGVPTVGAAAARPGAPLGASDHPAAASIDWEHLGQHAVGLDTARAGTAGATGATTASTARANTPTAPAGWYADPAGTPRTVRYWDGRRWTDHTARR